MDTTVAIHPDDQERLHAWATDHGVADSATAIGMLLDAAAPECPRTRATARRSTPWQRSGST